MAKSRKRKPSFDGPGDAEGTSDTGWVYRSEPAAPGRQAPPPPVIDVPPQRAAVDGADAPLREAAARQIVERYAMFAAAAGLVPLPFVDTAAIAGVQIAMVSALADHYNITFSRERGKTLIASLAGGVAPSFSSGHVAKFLIKRVPIAGTLFSAATEPALASAATYAIGRLFITHFASGGTLETLDANAARPHLTPQTA